MTADLSSSQWLLYSAFLESVKRAHGLSDAKEPNSSHFVFGALFTMLCRRIPAPYTIHARLLGYPGVYFIHWEGESEAGIVAMAHSETGQLSHAPPELADHHFKKAFEMVSIARLKSDLG